MASPGYRGLESPLDHKTGDPTDICGLSWSLRGKIVRMVPAPSPLLVVLGLLFPVQGRKGWMEGQSRKSDAGLGDRKPECVVVLPLMNKLTLGIGGPSYICGIDEMTSVGPSSSYTPCIRDPLFLLVPSHSLARADTSALGRPACAFGWPFWG